jgi:hypothetical protein
VRGLSDDYVFKFGKLLSFLSRIDVVVDQIVFPQRGAMRGEVEFLCAVPGSSKIKRTLDNPAGLVPYQEIAAQLPDLVMNWFNYYEEMEAILNLYFTAIAQSDIPVNTRFLCLHRRWRHITAAVIASSMWFSRLTNLKLGGMLWWQQCQRGNNDGSGKSLILQT